MRWVDVNAAFGCTDATAVTSGMPKGYPINLDHLHQYLWKLSDDRLHVVRIHQTELAEELGMTKYTMSRKMAQLIKEKRIARVGSSQMYAKYRVTDPEVWAAVHESE